VQELQLFQNEAFKVRAIEKEGKVYFVAKDIAEVLGYSNPNEAVRTHCKGVSEFRTPTNGGEQAVKIITESDAIRLIIRSRLPEAERFEKWIMEEVVPTVLKTGGYLNPSVDWSDLNNIQKVLDVAKEERAKRIRLEELRKEDQPKLEFYHAVRDTEKTITFEDFGRITGYGKNRLFKKARELKLIDAQNKAYQRYIDEGFFELKEKMTKIADHDVIYFQTRITGKGQAWLLKKIKESVA